MPAAHSRQDDRSNAAKGRLLIPQSVALCRGTGCGAQGRCRYPRGPRGSRWYSYAASVLAEPLGLGLVAGYQGLEDGPVAGGLLLVVLAPCRPHRLLAPAVVGPLAHLPALVLLVGIRPPIL